MADRTDPTGAPIPADPEGEDGERGARNRYVVKATVIEDTIRLSGDLVDDTIEVPRGEDARVTLHDTDEHYLYAVEVSHNGGRARSWRRQIMRTLSRQSFEAVDEDIQNIVYAVEKAARKKIVYGPVVVVKPKG